MSGAPLNIRKTGHLASLPFLLASNTPSPRQVACESPDCQALLQVGIPEEVRLLAPPQLVIRCASCGRLLQVCLPPETYQLGPVQMVPFGDSGQNPEQIQQQQQQQQQQMQSSQQVLQHQQNVSTLQQLEEQQRRLTEMQQQIEELKKKASTSESLPTPLLTQTITAANSALQQAIQATTVVKQSRPASSTGAPPSRKRSQMEQPRKELGDYHTFFRNEYKRIKTENPSMPGTEVFTLAAKAVCTIAEAAGFSGVTPEGLLAASGFTDTTVVSLQSKEDDVPTAQVTPLPPATLERKGDDQAVITPPYPGSGEGTTQQWSPTSPEAAALPTEHFEAKTHSEHLPLVPEGDTAKELSAATETTKATESEGGDY